MFKLVVVDVVSHWKNPLGYVCNIHYAGRHLRRQRVKQLPIIVNLDLEENAKMNLHSSDMYRCIHGSQPRSVVFELLTVGSLGVIELALQIDAPKKFNCVVYEMRDVTCVLVQKGERSRETDEPAAG